MEFVMELVRENGLELENVEDQTPEICLAAVKQNRMALIYIKNPQEFLSQLPKDDRLFIAKEVKDATAALIANGRPTQPLDGLANVLSQDASFEVRRAMIERNAKVDIHQSCEKSNERFMKKFGKDVDM